MTATRIPVNVPGSAYDVIIDPGLLGHLGPLVYEVAASRNALLVVDKRIASTHGRAATEAAGDWRATRGGRIAGLAR